MTALSRLSYATEGFRGGAGGGPPVVIEVPVPEPGLARYVQAQVIENVNQPVNIRHETEPRLISWTEE